MSITKVQQLVERIVKEELSLIEAKYVSPPEEQEFEEQAPTQLSYGQLPPIDDFKAHFEQAGGYYHSLNTHDQMVWDLALEIAGLNNLDEKDADQLYQAITALYGVPEESEIVRVGKSNPDILTKYKAFVKRYGEGTSASERTNFLADESATLGSDILNVLGYETV